MVSTGDCIDVHDWGICEITEVEDDTTVHLVEEA